MLEIRLIGPIDYDHIARALNELTGTSKRKSLFICSSGGDIKAALAFYDFVRGKKINLETVALGDVSSAAIIVWLAGTKRLVSRSTSMLVHPVSYFKTPNSTKNRNEERVQQLRVKYWNEVAAKIVIENSTLDLAAVQKIITERALLKPRDLVAFGLAHGLFGANSV